ncbi:hypothetical protein Salat_0663700 [Sesamum alatum]|uniref:Uncharacterized protein n=1 Tax=Sesamum alatum TaxID=300844 RepID=A0AAE1YRU7_9LAMI|nr:hypothetical protein Salat_0663700 [Sesamum alatum]
MYARVAELARALRRRNSPTAAPPPTNAEIIVAPVAGQAGHLVSLGINLLRSSSKDVSGEVEGVPTTESSKSKKRKRKGKSPRKAKSSSKSSKRLSKRAERRAAKDAAEEEENTRQFKDQVT